MCNSCQLSFYLALARLDTRSFSAISTYHSYCREPFEMSNLVRPRFPWRKTPVSQPLSAYTACRACLQSHYRLPRSSTQSFSTTRTCLNWLIPKVDNRFKDHKGRARVPTGGSTRGTTVIWGDYGLRMTDHDRRIKDYHFKNGEEVIRRRLRGTNFRLFTRWSTGVAVFHKGNESRMGTGKGRFDHWAARVPVSRVIFELSGDCHEQIIRDALRLAANKMPGESWKEAYSARG